MCIELPQELLDRFKPETEPNPVPQIKYHEQTYLIVSRVGYLLGVHKKHFSEGEGLDIAVYNQLNTDKNARIIRNLCIIRTAIEQHYKDIFNKMKYDLKNLTSLPEYIPQDSLMELENDGISLFRANVQPVQYIIDINRHISNKINNCRALVPTWLNWDYVKELFIMPNGTAENGVKAAANEFYSNKSSMPFGVYMNWPYRESGNILYNDKKFAQLLYESHMDMFTDLSKVSNAGLQEKNSIYSFLERSEKTAIIVDCENSDPYKLYAMLNNLDHEALLGKICKIILYNDVHTTTAWKILDRFTEIPVEHNMIERLKEQKSLADVMLTAGTCREHYINGTNSFILASSDSDFWGLISSMPELDFLVLVESRKCGPEIKAALDNRGFSYCYLDNFCTGNSDEIKTSAVLGEVTAVLDEIVSFNINEIFQNALTATRADMSDKEKKQFFDRYIKPMKLTIAKNGDIYVELGN